MDIMSPEEFAREMDELQHNYSHDQGERHFLMDDLMASVLRSLGYGEGIDFFEGTDRQYWGFIKE